MSPTTYIIVRYSRYKRVFQALEDLVNKLSSTEYIVLRENKRINYETKGYRLWMKFKKNKTIIEYYKPSDKDYDTWYVNQYLGHQVAGKYSRILFYVAAFASLTLVSLNPSYANLAVLLVGILIVLDYILHAYYNWSLIRQHNEAYHNIPVYKDMYDEIRGEILKILGEDKNDSLRTNNFLKRTWFRKKVNGQEVLAKHPI